MSRVLRPFAAFIPVALGYYLFQAHRQISAVPTSKITVADAVPPSFLRSKAFSIVNPRGYAGSNDTRSVVIELPQSKASESDEQILANFVEGFFGGWVFAPERLMLQALRRKLVNFSR